MLSFTEYLLSQRSGSSRVWPPPPRDPLPPFDPTTWETADPAVPPTEHPVFTDLQQVPPKQPDLRWVRGDAWGVTIPDLPQVPGGAPHGTPAEKRVLSYFLSRYGRSFEDKILTAHLDAGYTHFHLSPQDDFAVGMSRADFLAMARRVKDAGFFVTCWLRSKYYSTPGEWEPGRRLGETMQDAGVLDTFAPMGEMNWMSPEECRSLIDYDATWRDTTRVMLHFFPHYISWQENDQSPTSFWERNIGKCEGVWYQCNPEWTVGMMSARVQDCTRRLVKGGIWGLSQSFDFTAWETIATQQFNNLYTGNGRLADQDTGDLCGYELACVPGPMPVLGYGNGGRRPNGAAL